MHPESCGERARSGAATPREDAVSRLRHSRGGPHSGRSAGRFARSRTGHSRETPRRSPTTRTSPGSPEEAPLRRSRRTRRSSQSLQGDSAGPAAGPHRGPGLETRGAPAFPGPARPGFRLERPERGEETEDRRSAAQDTGRAQEGAAGKARGGGSAVRAAPRSPPPSAAGSRAPRATESRARGPRGPALRLPPGPAAGAPRRTGARAAYPGDDGGAGGRREQRREQQQEQQPGAARGPHGARGTGARWGGWGRAAAGGGRRPRASGRL